MLFLFVWLIFFFTLVLLEIYSRAGVQGEGGKQHSLSDNSTSSHHSKT